MKVRPIEFKPKIKDTQELSELFEPLIENIVSGKKVYTDASTKLQHIILPQLYILRSRFFSLLDNAPSIKMSGNNFSDKEVDQLGKEVYNLLTKRRTKTKIFGSVKTVRHIDELQDQPPDLNMLKNIKNSLKNDKLLILAGLWGGIKLRSENKNLIFSAFPEPNPDLADMLAIEILSDRFEPIKKLGVKIHPVIVITNGFAYLDYPNLSYDSDFPAPELIFSSHELYTKGIKEIGNYFGFDVIHAQDVFNLSALLMDNSFIEKSISYMSSRMKKTIEDESYLPYWEYLSDLSTKHVNITTPYQRAPKPHDYSFLTNMDNCIQNYNFSFLNGKTIDELIRIFSVSSVDITDKEAEHLMMFLSSVGVKNLTNLLNIINVPKFSPMKFFIAVSIVHYDMFLSELLYSLFPNSIQFTYLDPSYTKMVSPSIPYLFYSPFGKGFNNRPWFISEKDLIRNYRFPEIQALR
ncbi:hypothetical protein KO465_02235 [Candidatus Micrarchaeota archaeon]|nr:hypothetical protein [Candidatus Micrarchaeota archaeon]